MATRDYEENGYDEDRYAKGGQTSYTVDNPEPPQPGPAPAPTPGAPVPPTPPRQRTPEEIYAEMRAATGTPTEENRQQLLKTFKDEGYNASPYMYGNTQSGNELSINGAKTKFTSGGNFGDPNAQWYNWGSNDQGSAGTGGGGMNIPSTSSVMAGFSNWRPMGGGYQPSSIFAGAPGGADANAFFQFLLGRANGSIKDSSIPNLQVGPDDPIIRRQTDAYGAQQTRGGRRYLQELAERSGPNANIGTESRMVAEKGNQATAGFEGQLISQELNARRTQLQQALSTGAQFMSEQQRMQLQEELAQIENARQMYQFEASQGQQESQFERDLSQRAFEFGSNDIFRNSPNGSGG